MVGTGLLLVVIAVFFVAGFYRWAWRQVLPGTGPAATVRHEGSARPLTEAVAYAGATLLLAGGITSVGQRWDSVSGWGHAGMFAGAAAFFLLAGIFARRAPDPPFRRLAGVVWVLTVVSAGAATGFATREVYHNPASVTVLAVGAVSAAYSAALWLARRSALQNATLFAGLIIVICGIVLNVTGGLAPAPPLALALALWAFGLGWAWLGWRGHLKPAWTAITGGVVLALSAPSLAITHSGWMYAIGIGTAAAAMAASVRLRDTPLLATGTLAAGTLAVFGYVTSVVVRYFRESLGVTDALVIAGVLILGLATVSARLAYAARRRGPAAEPGPD